MAILDFQWALLAELPRTAVLLNLLGPESVGKSEQSVGFEYTVCLSEINVW